MSKIENPVIEKINLLKFIDIIPDAIVVVNHQGNITHVNSSTTKLFGYTPDELMGKQVEVLMPNRFQLKHTKRREDYAIKPVSRPMGSGLELFGKRKDGSEFPIDIMLAPIEIDECPSVISVIRDMTVQKKIETEIKRSARQLEDLVSTLTHDLKTPLIAAETSFKHLLSGHFGELTSGQKEILNLLIINNTATLRLVNNLMSTFKYESKSYKLLLELTDISEIFNKAINTIKSMLEEKNITLNVSETSFKFVCDPFEIERVIINLLTNSIKYTPRGGNIELRGLKNDDGKVIVTVKDTGKGISKEDLSKIFERFWQSHKSSADSNSTGLGLYLCKQIINAHGGEIWAESQVQKGTEVTFEIPQIN